MRNIFFMPLRKGSKSIKNKNCTIFYKKPLFCWYIDAIIGSKTADEIWIATDCLKVVKIAKEKYPNVHIFHRAKENATDTSPTIDVVLEFLETKFYKEDDNFILVQATSPLTSSSDLLKLQHKKKKKKKDSYVSCVRVQKFRWTEDGIPLDYDLDKKPRRQEYKGFLVESGAFYCSKIRNILHTGKLISGKIGVIELGDEAIVDIDEPTDWKIGEAYMRYIKEKKL